MKNYKYKKKLGGKLGTILGTGAGALIGQPALGATVGNAVGSQFDNPQTNRQRTIPSTSSFGYRKGGKLKKYPMGGELPIGPDAGLYEGPSHEQGGIPVDAQGKPSNNAVAEVEGGETRQGDYIFSDEMIVPGTDMTFAEAHQMLLQEGADEAEIQQLMQMQEETRMQEQPEQMGMGEETPMMETGGKINPLENVNLQRTVPSAVKAGAALFAPKPKPMQNVQATTIDADTSSFRNARNDLNTMARTNKNPGTQAQLLRERSNLAASESELRTNVANQNAISRGEADRTNAQINHSNREMKAADTGRRINLLTSAIQRPLDMAAADKATERQVDQSILMAASNIQDPTDRDNFISTVMGFIREGLTIEEAIARGQRARGKKEREMLVVPDATPTGSPGSDFGS